jgi:hypothetical protein
MARDSNTATPIRTKLVFPKRWFIDNLIIKDYVINLLAKLVDQIADFDLKKKVAVIMLIGIIGIWAGYSAYNEFSFPYEDCKSFGKLAEYGMGICTDYGKRLMFMYEYEELHRWNNPLRTVTYELLFLSDNVFGDYRVIPFISSGLVLLFTYLITNQLTGRNYTGLIAVLFVLHSPIFYKYDLIMTYPNFWVTFFLASLWFTFNKWMLSPVSIFVGMSAKILNFLNLPAVIVFTLLTDNKNKSKIIKSYILILVGIVSTIFLSKFVYPPLWHKIYFAFLVQFDFQPTEFLWWLGMWSIELFTDKITLFLIFILLPCLFLLKKSKVKNASAILAMIIIFILQPAFISGFTGYTNEDYRYLHLVVFVGIGVAFIIPNIKKLSVAFQSYFTIKK